MDRNMDVYFLTSSRMRICIGIAAVPDAGWPGWRLPAGLLCGGDDEPARRGRHSKGQGARRRASEREGRRAGEGDEPTKETSKRA